MTTLAIIPARGGSKGIPGKNIRLLAGKPLVAWTIEAALTAASVDRVVVSTDSEEIASVSRDWGADIIYRPKALAEDWSPSEDALIHVLETIDDADDIGLVVFLQATSPIRTAEDIDAAVARFHASSADSLLSVSPSHALLWREEDGVAQPLNTDIENRPRRQEMDQFRENGSIYVLKPEVLLRRRNRLGGKIVLFEMSEEAGLDIDTELDFILAGQILGEGATGGAAAVDISDGQARSRREEPV